MPRKWKLLFRKIFIETFRPFLSGWHCDFVSTPLKIPYRGFIIQNMAENKNIYYNKCHTVFILSQRTITSRMTTLLKDIMHHAILLRWKWNAFDNTIILYNHYSIRLLFYATFILFFGHICHIVFFSFIVLLISFSSEIFPLFLYY